MNENQLQILNDLEDIETTLRKVLVNIKEENKNNQFDYRTNASLGNRANNVRILATKIENIVFQKNSF